MKRVLLLLFFIIISCSKETSEDTIENLHNVPSNFNLDSKYLFPQTYYSVDLSWDKDSISKPTRVNIYRGDNKQNLNLFNSLSATANRYTDTLVSVRKEYFYQISYVYDDYEYDKTEVISIKPFEPKNDLEAPLYPTPNGIHYAWQKFNQNSFESIKHKFTIHEEPSNDAGLYYQFYQGFINDTIGFYYGIQTTVNHPEPPHSRGKGLIFSRWKTRDTTNYSIANGGWGKSAGYEGDFISVRNSFDWGVGTYEIELKKDSVDSVGDWYSVKIKNILEIEQTHFGSIRFETSSLSSGIKSGGAIWSELYLNSSDGSIPDWHVSVDDILIEGEYKPNKIETVYNKNFEDFSNIYTTNKNDIHFLVGPEVKKITPEQTFIWNED